MAPYQMPDTHSKAVKSEVASSSKKTTNKINLKIKIKQTLKWKWKFKLKN